MRGRSEPTEAELFDAVARHQRGGEDLPIWLALASAASGPVLELGAGTARVLSALLSAGVDAYGVEIDGGRRDHGLRRLAHEGRSDGPERLLLRDLRQPWADEPFGLVLATYNVLALVNDEDLVATLGVLGRALRPGGALMVEAQAWPRWAAPGEPIVRTSPMRELPSATGSVRYQEQSRLHPAEGLLDVEQTFEPSGGAPITRRITLRIRSLTEWDALLAEAGWCRRGPAVDKTGATADDRSRLVFFGAAPVQ